MHDDSDEFRGAHAGELGGKRQHQDRIDAGIAQQLQACLERSNEAGAAFRAEETQRMRIKGNRDGTRRPGRGAEPEPFEDELMPEMDAVEVADAHDRTPKVPGNLAEVAEYVHGQISKPTRKPS